MKIFPLFLLLVVLFPALQVRAQSQNPTTLDIGFYGNESVSSDDLVDSFEARLGNFQL
ncbi:MAG: hypothetical protein ABI481_13435 [Pyrinomonadaceae bacterium]